MPVCHNHKISRTLLTAPARVVARLSVLYAALLWSGTCLALDIEMPGNAILQTQSVQPAVSDNVPIGAWVEGYIPTIRAEGTRTRQVWRLDSAGLTTLQILDPLRSQILEAGYELLYSCQTEQCGSFDFRFGISLERPPAMQVDLSDYRFLSAQKGSGEKTEVVTLFVSRTSRAGFVQISAISADGSQVVQTSTRATPDTVAPTTNLSSESRFSDELESTGRVILDDLSFASGSSELSEGSYSSLGELAAYLQRNPSRRVALVGHTDADGTLEGNIVLSRRRAAAVLERLVTDYAAERQQLDAQGMGYLAPIASNLTEEGRNENRRVEVILTSTQ